MAALEAQDRVAADTGNRLGSCSWPLQVCWPSIHASTFKRVPRHLSWGSQLKRECYAGCTLSGFKCRVGCQMMCMPFCTAYGTWPTSTKHKLFLLFVTLIRFAPCPCHCYEGRPDTHEPTEQYRTGAATGKPLNDYKKTTRRNSSEANGHRHRDCTTFSGRKKDRGAGPLTRSVAVLLLAQQYGTAATQEVSSKDKRQECYAKLLRTARSLAQKCMRSGNASCRASHRCCIKSGAPHAARAHQSLCARSKIADLHLAMSLDVDASRATRSCTDTQHAGNACHEPRAVLHAA